MSKLSHLLVLNQQFWRILCKDSFGFRFALADAWNNPEVHLFTGSCRLLRRLFNYARGSTQMEKKKIKNKIGAEFMTSVSYRPEVINLVYAHTRAILDLLSLCHKINILLKTHYSLWCHKGDICISNKVEYLKKKESYKNSTKEVT
jgi:hypothetical protein